MLWINADKMYITNTLHHALREKWNVEYGKNVFNGALTFNTNWVSENVSVIFREHGN